MCAFFNNVAYGVHVAHSSSQYSVLCIMMPNSEFKLAEMPSRKSARNLKVIAIQFGLQRQSQPVSSRLS